MKASEARKITSKARASKVSDEEQKEVDKLVKEAITNIEIAAYGGANRCHFIVPSNKIGIRVFQILCHDYGYEIYSGRIIEGNIERQIVW